MGKFTGNIGNTDSTKTYLSVRPRLGPGRSFELIKSYGRDETGDRYPNPLKRASAFSPVWRSEICRNEEISKRPRVDPFTKTTDYVVIWRQQTISSTQQNHQAKRRWGILNFGSWRRKNDTEIESTSLKSSGEKFWSFAKFPILSFSPLPLTRRSTRNQSQFGLKLSESTGPRRKDDRPPSEIVKNTKGVPDWASRMTHFSHTFSR